MIRYILTCPTCGSQDIRHYGSTFICNECDETTEWEDMDFEMEECYE